MATEQSFIDFQCPYCQEPVSFPEDYAGMVQECPSCTESLVVPRESGGMGGKIPIPITTPRLALRRPVMGDWKDLLEFLSDEALFQHVADGPVGEEALLRWLDGDQHVKLTTPNTTYTLGLALQPAGKIIGILYLRFSETLPWQCNLMIYLNRNHQRQGFATEALQAVMNFCFAGIGVHRITATCDSRHAAARRVCDKLGMRREGEFLKDRFINGEWVNTVWYALLREEYLNAKSPAIS